MAIGRARVDRPAPPHRLDRRLAASVLVTLGLVLGSATLAFLGQLEIFPPRFRFMVTAGGTQAFVYEVGFLEQEILVGTRRGGFPTHTPLTRVRGCGAAGVKLDADGHTLRVCGRRCDLRSWRCE